MWLFLREPIRYPGFFKYNVLTLMELSPPLSLARHLLPVVDFTAFPPGNSHTRKIITG